MAQPVPGSRHARPAARPTTSKQPLFYLNLRPFTWAGVALLIVLPPYLRGLFFQPELLLVQMLVAITFAFWLGDRLLRRTPALPAAAGGSTGRLQATGGPAADAPAARRLHSLDALVCLYVVAYLLSLFAAVNVRAAVGEVLEALALAMLYFVVSRLILTPRHVVQVLEMIFWAAVGVAVVGLGAALGVIYYPGAFDGHVIMSTFQYKNTLAAYLTTVYVVGVFLQARSVRVVSRVLHGAGNILILVTLLSTQSRGGWLLLPVALVLFLLGLPRAHLYRSLYTILLSLGVSMLVSRSFIPAMLAGEQFNAIRALATGLVAIIVIEVVVDYGLRLARRRLVPRTRTFLAAAGGIYGAFIVVLYFYFAAQAFPSVAGQLLSSQVLARAQTISGYEPSFQSRLVFDRDALKIIADHPLIGTGGGGWNALYHTYQDSQYFTTEVHNHFLQVGVEAGLIGLVVFVLLWLALVWILLRLRRTLEDDDTAAPGWAAGIAALTLAGHSFFDFNLSLPAMTMMLWTFLALVRGAEQAVEGGNVPPAGRPAPPGPDAPGWQAALGQVRKWAVRPYVWGPLCALLAVALFLPSYNFYRAGRTGAAAARALEARELPRAQELYRAAYRLDPYTATYVADLAQVNTALGLAEQDETLLDEARGLAARAAALEPYNPQIRATTSLVYLLQGYLDLAVEEAEAIVAANPWDVGAYEQLGSMYVGAAQAYRRHGAAEMAAAYLNRVLTLPEAVAEQAAKAVSTEPAWQGPRLEVTPRMEMLAGQAAYLTGDYGLAVEKLERAGQKKNLEQEAVPWLAAALARSGRQEEAEEYLARYPGLRSQYTALLEGE